jgi:hypothetical protein
MVLIVDGCEETLKFESFPRTKRNTVSFSLGNFCQILIFLGIGTSSSLPLQRNANPPENGNRQRNHAFHPSSGLGLPVAPVLAPGRRRARRKLEDVSDDSDLDHAELERASARLMDKTDVVISMQYGTILTNQIRNTVFCKTFESAFGKLFDTRSTSENSRCAWTERGRRAVSGTESVKKIEPVFLWTVQRKKALFADPGLC